MNKILRGFSIILALTLVAVLISWEFYFKRMREIGKLSIGHVDTASVADGIHSGHFETPYKTYRVNVSVINHEITRIEVEPGDRFWSYFDNEAKAVGKQVIRRQCTDVDVVSGATITSKAILKAIENALLGVGGII